MCNLVHKEISNIFSLITNKYFSNKVLSIILSKVDIVNFIIKNSINKNLIFNYKNFDVQALYFPVLIEILRQFSVSENTEIINYFENHLKWNVYNQFFFNPLKERLKEGLLPPNKNLGRSFKYSDADEYFNENSNNINNNDNNLINSPNKRNVSKKSSSIDLPIKMLPFRDFVSQLCVDYNTGKQDSIISNEITMIHSVHKDDSNFDNNDNYHICEDGMFLHESIYNNISKNDSGNNYNIASKLNLSNSSIDKANNYNKNNSIYYDNVYWSANLIIDEVEIEELTKDISSFKVLDNSNNESSNQMLISSKESIDNLLETFNSNKVGNKNK